MGLLEILTKLMGSHFIHETCWYVVLFLGLQFLTLALLNVNMTKLVLWQENATGGDLRCPATVLRKWVTNEIMVLTRQGYFSNVWIVY